MPENGFGSSQLYEGWPDGERSWSQAKSGQARFIRYCLKMYPCLGSLNRIRTLGSLARTSSEARCSVCERQPFFFVLPSENPIPVVPEAAGAGGPSPWIK